MAKKADSKVKVCLDCGVDISEREGGAKRCVPCAVSSPKKQAEERRSERSLVRAQKEYVEEQKRIIRAEEKEKAAAVEKMLKVRQCIDCNADISKRGGGTKRCLSCAEIRAEQLKEKRVMKDWKNKGMPACETVTGQPYGVTIRQKGYMELLLSETGYNYEQIKILAKRDGAIRPNEKISGIDNLNIRQASRLISYLVEIHEYLEL